MTTDAHVSLVTALIWVGILVLCGCSQAPLTAPSGAAVSGAIATTQTKISQAQIQNKSIAGYNEQQRTLAQRIHDKDLLIDRWRETHGQ
jgi:basic membrane lipoprotein Med (substrate-binding protein (PBP1-ABC) superfamily)